MELTSLRSILEEAVKSFRQSGTPVLVEMDLPGSMPQVIADRQRITQVLHNLLGNAAKHSPPDQSIRVEAHDDGILARICVLDAGPGIRPDQVSRLFKRYARTEESGQLKLPGSGLGLYISKGIVEAHGGRVWMENRPAGTGAEFCFSLPVAPRTAPEDLVSAGDFGAERGSHMPAAVRKRRIVALDDDVQSYACSGARCRSQASRPRSRMTPARSLSLSRRRIRRSLSLTWRCRVRAGSTCSRAFESSPGCL